MFYLKISICALGILMALYICAISLFKRFRYAVNRLLVFIALVTAVMLSSLLYQLLSPGSAFLNQAGLLYFAAISLMNQLYFHYASIFPRWEKRSPLWFILTSALPGTVMFFITLTPGLVLGSAEYHEGIVYTYGEYFPLYGAVFAFNALGTFFTTLYKARTLENESFRAQLFYRSIGDYIGAALIVLTLIVLPYFFGIQGYHDTGVPVAVILLLLINNYAVSGERRLDFKKFYSRAAYNMFLFVLLLLPAIPLIQYRDSFAVAGQEIPVAGIAVVIFIYLILSYRLLAPRINRFFGRQYTALERTVNELFRGFSTSTEKKDQAGFWDAFFSETIDALESRLGIGDASLYIYRSKDESYLYSYGFGEGIQVRSIEGRSDLVKCLGDFPGLLEISMIFTDERMSQYSPSLLKFFAENRVKAVLPFYNPEKKLIGILLLGDLKTRRPYPSDLVSALDLYRIHFEASLSNSLHLEEIASAQVSEHDQILIRNIKTRITPKKLNQIDGLRISSLHMNQSAQGGDYFDTVILKPDKLGIFMADTSDAGIDSALLALEFYTVLHTQQPSFESPERLMNVLNWVVTTSRFSESHASALYAVYTSSSRTLSYCNAAMKPLVCFDPSRDAFTDLDITGIPVGVDKSFTYESRELHVPPGFIGLLYSDGLESALSGTGVAYTIGRIKDIIRLNLNETPAVLVRKIYTDFREFTKDTGLLQDVSVMVFRSY